MMEKIVEGLVYVLLYFAPGQPADMPTYVSTWSTMEGCERKAAILNNYFKLNPRDMQKGFHCIPANVRNKEELP